MSFFPNGEWRIKGVLINQETVLNNEGFQFLQIQDDDLVILPADIHFQVKQSRPSSAVLESRGQVYFAEFAAVGKRFALELSRPKFREKIQIEAELVTANVAESAVHN